MPKRARHNASDYAARLGAPGRIKNRSASSFGDQDARVARLPTQNQIEIVESLANEIWTEHTIKITTPIVLAQLMTQFAPYKI